ncbi:hypothetical protein [Streptomyces boninensis]|uniref:hypothetical protein n=1 Tax=Streptomyces boninensis TaxID=2039455 RepID=UPI003B20B649
MQYRKQQTFAISYAPAALVAAALFATGNTPGALTVAAFGLVFAAIAVGTTGRRRS